MRVVLFILIAAVVALILAVATGLLRIDQAQPARVPDIDANGASGGQLPTFDIETGSVSVDARQRNVTVPVPRLEVRPADERQEAGNASEAAPTRE